MTRTAPLMTLLAVGVLGGALFVANTVGAQEPTPASTTAAASTAAGQPAPDPAAPPAAPPAEPPAAEPPPAGRELDLSQVEVAGAPAGRGEQARPAEPAQEPAPAADDEPSSTFAGESNDGTLTVAIAVQGNDAAAVVSDGQDEFVLDGTATAAGLDLENRAGTVKLSGDNPDNTFTGTITVDGERVRYTAEGTSAAEAQADGRTDVATAAKRVGP